MMAKTKKMALGGMTNNRPPRPPMYGGGKPATSKMPAYMPRGGTGGGQAGIAPPGSGRITSNGFGAPNISPVGAQGPVVAQQPTATASPDGYGSKFPPGKVPPPPADLERMPGPTGMKKGGKVSSASNRGDGCAVRGKTKGRFV